VDFAGVTSKIHCRPCCNFLISWCYQQSPEYRPCRLLGYRLVADVVIVRWRIL